MLHTHTNTHTHSKTRTHRNGKCVLIGWRERSKLCNTFRLHVCATSFSPIFLFTQPPDGVTVCTLQKIARGRERAKEREGKGAVCAGEWLKCMRICIENRQFGKLHSMLIT